jgi:hypothetical protein
MSGDDLYEATRKWWKMAPSRRPDYAFAVYEGVMRACIGSISKVGSATRPQGGGHSRPRDAAMERSYVWNDVPDRLPRGSQNPIRYVGC